MADRLRPYIIAKKIHIFSALIVTGFLTMYIITGFLMTRHNLWQPKEEKPVSAEYELLLPEGLPVDKVSGYIKKEFDLRGHTGKPQADKKGVVTILYARPGMRYQAVVAADRQSVVITATKTNLRATITGFHRLKGYGGGSVYDLYVFMTDLTAISLIVFALTGIYLGLYDKKNILFKIALLIAGIGYTLIVVYAFMKG